MSDDHQTRFIPPHGDADKNQTQFDDALTVRQQTPAADGTRVPPVLRPAHSTINSMALPYIKGRFVIEEILGSGGMGGNVIKLSLPVFHC